MGTKKTTQDQDESLSGGEPQPYLVTPRSDVLFDGELHTDGDTIWLDQAVAKSLLDSGCIKPKEGSE